MTNKQLCISYRENYGWDMPTLKLARIIFKDNPLLFPILYPLDTEEEVIHKSVILTNTLWNEHFRKIDNNNSIPLQDGTK